MTAQTMHAVHLTGHGGFEKLEYRTDVPIPTPSAQEVLINVTAAGVNNTDINTRTAWYSKAVATATNQGGCEGFGEVDQKDSSWAGSAIQFPRIQGADCCGIVVAVGEGVSESRIGERVLVRTMHDDFEKLGSLDFFTLGSEMDGGFAQYLTIHEKAVYAVDSEWSDVELASVPCAYSTAENMLHRTKLGAERVLITGASGGVGSAAVQLAKRRGAEVIALASPAKFEQVKALGADTVLARDADLVAELGADSVDLVVDLVAGDEWPKLLDVLKRGGRYATSGAIAGPMVSLDVRTLYLKDLTFFGCTYQEAVVFQNLVGYIERNEIKPAVAATYALSDIVTAQQDFLAKQFTGKLVLIPPSLEILGAPVAHSSR